MKFAGFRVLWENTEGEECNTYDMDIGSVKQLLMDFYFDMSLKDNVDVDKWIKKRFGTL